LTYDSTQETLNHISKVADFIRRINEENSFRAAFHDATKLQSPEKEVFDIVTPKIKTLVYGSEAYNKQIVNEMEDALNHHYTNNRHHPQFHKNGIKDMNLIDIVEMLCDWKASSLRSPEGDIRKSLEINKKRFQISDDIYQMLSNTIDYLGW